MLIGLEEFLRFAIGLGFWWITLCYLVVTLRAWSLKRVHWIIKVLFHAALPTTMLFLWSAIGSYSGVFFYDVYTYRIFRLSWLLIVVIWCSVALGFGLFKITVELKTTYDKSRRETPKGHNG